MNYELSIMNNPYGHPPGYVMNNVAACPPTAAFCMPRHVCRSRPGTGCNMGLGAEIGMPAPNSPWPPLPLACGHMDNE